MLLSYLIRFLMGEAPGNMPGEAPAVGYTGDRQLFSRYALVIIPSGFFDEGVYGTPASLPALPLKEIDGWPILFGEAKEEQIGNTRVMYADLIAGAYFLISRYEEMVRREVRDEHGRFPGRESLPFRAGFIHRPVVDGYRALLRSRLGLPEPEPGIRQIYLTHDVDAPFLYRSWKGLVRSLLDGRGIARTLGGKFGPAEEDPYYTFPRLFEADRFLTEQGPARSIYFFKAGGRTPADKPRYNLRSKDLQHLIRSIHRQGAEIGLHASYEAGIHPSLIAGEKERLQRSAGLAVSSNRHHFLASRHPEDMDYAETAGLTDDFTLGYADTAGFRLGTCHAVRYINPLTRRLTSLCLHPLTVMDCTLEEEKYMHLSFEEALACCRRLTEEVRRAGGELSLLWHNTSLREDSGSYLPQLYAILLNELSLQ
ncbi:MAG: polysaccharide deacetylase family protein [Tannerellaceae bacterium]|jgi:hypothetical protein|nr:polysaccharide deacetylase family protein [Tannerellaceae bacterium]